MDAALARVLRDAEVTEASSRGGTGTSGSAPGELVVVSRETLDNHPESSKHWDSHSHPHLSASWRSLGKAQRRPQF